MKSYHWSLLATNGVMVREQKKSANQRLVESGEEEMKSWKKLTSPTCNNSNLTLMRNVFCSCESYCKFNVIGLVNVEGRGL